MTATLTCPSVLLFSNTTSSLMVTNTAYSSRSSYHLDHILPECTYQKYTLSVDHLVFTRFYSRWSGLMIPDCKALCDPVASIEHINEKSCTDYIDFWPQNSIKQPGGCLSYVPHRESGVFTNVGLPGNWIVFLPSVVLLHLGRLCFGIILNDYI